MRTVIVLSLTLSACITNNGAVVYAGAPGATAHANVYQEVKQGMSYGSETSETANTQNTSAPNKIKIPTWCGYEWCR